ncbi:MAG: hypothetical protein ACLQDM_28580 [Bradyrhizobium sp.]
MSKLGIVVAATLSLAAISVAVYAWMAMGAVTISVEGMISLVLGGLATFALGAGLMALLFYSNRHGYDDAAGAPPDRKPPERKSHLR